MGSFNPIKDSYYSVVRTHSKESNHNSCWQVNVSPSSGMLYGICKVVSPWILMSHLQVELWDHCLRLSVKVMPLGYLVSQQSIMGASFSSFFFWLLGTPNSFLKTCLEQTFKKWPLQQVPCKVVMPQVLKHCRPTIILFLQATYQWQKKEGSDVMITSDLEPIIKNRMAFQVAQW